MCDGAYRGIRSYKHVVADGHWSLVEYGYVEVAKETVADVYVVTDVASERGGDMIAAAYRPKQCVYYLVSAVGGGWRKLVEFVAQLRGTVQRVGYFGGKTVMPPS